MILTDREILEAIEKGQIVIDPFDRKSLGSNSYDVHLGSTLVTYSPRNPAGRDLEGVWPRDAILDCKKELPAYYYEIPENGVVLCPGVLYLGSTLEYTETHCAVPFLDGKSSIGRLGIFIHATAGRGDIGFCNHWTMELSVVQPVRVYAGMPIGQLIYHGSGQPIVPYNRKEGAKYNGRDPLPQPSKMWRNFPSKAQP